MKKKVFICIMGLLYALILFSPSSTVFAGDRVSRVNPNDEGGGGGAIELGEVTITCDSGRYGRCHIITQEVVGEAFGVMPIFRYVCKFSGMQDDSCSYWTEVFMNIE